MAKRQNKTISLLHGYKISQNLTYDQLAAETGFNAVTLNEWMLGKVTPKSESIAKVRAFLKSKGFKGVRRTKEEIEKGQTMAENYVKHFGEIGQPSTLEVVATQQFGNKTFEVYGSTGNPLFLAVEVAEMIEIQNTTDLLKRIDKDEKLTYVVSRAGQRREMNFLTEYGVYEVLMQSRKPIAKEFKKVVKHVLHEIRTKGYYVQGGLIREAPQTTPAIEIDPDVVYVNHLLQNALDETDKTEKFKKVIKARIMVETIDKLNG